MHCEINGPRAHEKRAVCYYFLDGVTLWSCVVDTEALETLLAGAEETDSLEFKGAMPWDRNTLAKDILALANVIDGGRIIVGVEDETFQRQGLTEEQAQTYNIDHMRDGIAPFADPRVVFRCAIVSCTPGGR